MAFQGAQMLQSVLDRVHLLETSWDTADTRPTPQIDDAEPENIDMPSGTTLLDDARFYPDVFEVNETQDDLFPTEQFLGNWNGNTASFKPYSPRF